MGEIKTKRESRRLSSTLIDTGLELVAKRSEIEGVSKDTAKRHAAAIRGVVHALGGTRSRVIKPGSWVALYARSDSTSTVISNMKFAAVIFEWAGCQQYEDSKFYSDIAIAIRTALAVRG